MIKLSETTNATYRTDIGSIVIRYSIRKEGDSPVENINANIQKNELDAGTANLDKDGACGFSLRKGLSVEERIAILTAIVNDSDEIFNTKPE